MGDRVEVLTLKGSGPSRDWLNIAKTPTARSKIRAYFSRVTKDDDILHGRELLGREMRKHGVVLSSTRLTKAVKTVAESLDYRDADDLLARVGAGKQSARQTANRLLKELTAEQQGNAEAPSPDRLFGLNMTGLATPDSLKPKAPRVSKGSSGVVVKGLDGVLVRLSHCCNPVPGDEIIGFVTRGRGVTIHRTNCPNARALMASPERIIDVAWTTDVQSSEVYKVEVLIEAIDRLHLYQDVTVALGSSGVNFLSATMTTHKDGIVEMLYLFEVSEIAHIEKILRELRGIEGVIDARRTMPGEVVRTRRGT
jgi:GTP pyrophosphokinase